MTGDGMYKRLGSAIASLALASGILASGGPAGAEGGVQIGTLTCNVSGGWGFVLGSSKAVRCTFARAGGRPEHYAGSINKFGVDIGYTQGGVLIWGVFAPSANLAPGGLSGNYLGATGSATVGGRRRRQCPGRRLQPNNLAPAAEYRGKHRP